MASLRAEADTATFRAEEAEAKVKKLEQELLEKDQELNSSRHQLGLLEKENEVAESKLAEFKANNLDSEASRMTTDGLARKVQLLEEELDAAEKNVKETVEKCVLYFPSPLSLVLCDLYHLTRNFLPPSSRIG